MLQKIKNLFRRKSTHEKMWYAMQKYAHENHIQLTSPQGHRLQPARLGKTIGQHVLQQYYLKGGR